MLDNRKELVLRLRRLMDVSGMRKRLRECAIRDDRLFVYEDVLSDACERMFSVSEYDRGMRSGSVWCLDGGVWSEVSGGMFEDIVRDAFCGCLGMKDVGAGILKRDWTAKSGKILSYAYRGAERSVMRLSADCVGFANGIWDFSDIDVPKCLNDVDSKVGVKRLLDYDYDEDAGCPLWCSFLSMMLRPSDIRVLQMYLGLGCVCRRDMRHKVEDMLWLVGGGANGKSTILDVVRAVYGWWNIGEASLSGLLDKHTDSRRWTIRGIVGKVFNVCQEVDMTDVSHASGILKSLCSGEPQEMRSLQQDIQVAYDIPFLIFCMNQMPENRRMDGALARRIVKIEFRSTIREDEMDKELGKKLLGELSGIRNWMMQGYKMLRDADFKMPHVEDGTYMEQNEQYFDLFARKEGLRASSWAGHGEVPYNVVFSTLYDAFCSWCKREQYDEPTAKQLTKDLKRMGFKRIRNGKGVHYEMFCDKDLTQHERIKAYVRKII